MLRFPPCNRQFFASDIAILFYLALFKFFLHFLTNHQYNYQRDEFYFVDCARHLGFGYVDHPPMIAFITKLSLLLFGDSVHDLRIFSALAGGIKVFLMGLLVHEMGGGRFAQIVATVMYIFAPVYLGTDTILCIPSFEQLWWLLSFYTLLLIIKYDKPTYWLLFGYFAGLGLMTKHSMLFLGFGLSIGLLLTPHRKYILSPWIWAGGLFAFAIFLPNILWQIHYDWPTVEFMKNLNKHNLSHIAPFEFLAGQILYMGLPYFPIWIIGLFSLLFLPRFRSYQIFGWIFLSIFILLLLLKSKIYYLAPAYPMLFVAGAITLEQWTNLQRWLRPTIICLLLVPGILFVPLAIPILPFSTFNQFITVFTQIAPNAYELKYGFADMFGWENQVKTVAGVYNALPPEEKAKCTIVGNNYGETSAINFYGPKYHLPKAIDTHMTYFLWGPGDATFDIVIKVGSSKQELSQFFDDIQQAALITNENAVYYENNLPVFLCRKPKVDIRALWPELKNY